MRESGGRVTKLWGLPPLGDSSAKGCDVQYMAKNNDSNKYKIRSC
jgi:hypothetical protein